MKKRTKEIKELIVRMEICLDDEFEKYYYSDMNTWIKELQEIRDAIK